MDLGLRNKVCIVSGSSRGIGREIAQTLLAEGACVCLTGRDLVALRAAHESLRSLYSDQVHYFEGDVNEKSVLEQLNESVIRRWGKIDHLVANAGSVRPVPEIEVKEEDWDWYFEGNFKLAYRFVTHFLPAICETKGSVVFISSIAGVEEIGAPLPYSSAKAALAMYAKGLSGRVASRGVRVNTVAPGNIFFEGGNWDRKMKMKPEGIKKMLEDNVPMARFGAPQDVAAATAFLLSQKAKFITGCSLVVDGGQTSKFV